MKNISFYFLCALCTLQGFAQRPTLPARVYQPRAMALVSAGVTRSYDWWNYVNPSHVNYFSTFSGVNPINYDTGVISFSKRTAISLVGWINQNINLAMALSDDSLVHLEPLLYMEQLLVSSSITDAGVNHVRPLTRLRHFEVAVSGVPAYNITDNSMDILGGLGNMEILRMYFCSRVTDRGLQKLRGLTRLRELQLNGCGITDKGLIYLSAFTNLETLGLAATAIDDEGADLLIQQLPSMPALKTIVISHSQITEKGRNKLMKSRNGISLIY